MQRPHPAVALGLQQQVGVGQVGQQAPPGLALRRLAQPVQGAAGTGAAHLHA